MKRKVNGTNIQNHFTFYENKNNKTVHDIVFNLKGNLIHLALFQARCRTHNLRLDSQTTSSLLVSLSRVKWLTVAFISVDTYIGSCTNAVFTLGVIK